MAVTCLTRDTLPQFVSRVESLSAQSKPRFGTMSVVGMMRHLRNALETALGETDLPDDFTPLRGRLMYLFACRVMTRWPKGKIKAPAYWTPPAEHEFDEERRLFLKALARFVEAHQADARKVTKNPFFGPLSMKQWSRLNGIHLDHHLKQFGA